MGQLTKEQIAKKLLKPYFDDPSLCSIDEAGTCLYNGPGGRMCVFARACTLGGRKLLKEGQGSHIVLDDFGTKILQEKYRHISDTSFWGDLQYVHDVLAAGSRTALERYKDLTGEEYNAE